MEEVRSSSLLRSTDEKTACLAVFSLQRSTFVYNAPTKCRGVNIERRNKNKALINADEKKYSRKIGIFLAALFEKGEKVSFYLPGTGHLDPEQEETFSAILDVIKWPEEGLAYKIKSVTEFGTDFWLKYLCIDGRWSWDQYFRGEDWLSKEFGHKYTVSTKYPHVMLHCFWSKNAQDVCEEHFVVSVNTDEKEFAHLTNIPEPYQLKMAEFNDALSFEKPSSVLIGLDRNIDWMQFKRLLLETFPGIVFWDERSCPLPSDRNNAFAFHIGRCLVQELIEPNIVANKSFKSDESGIYTEIRVRMASAAYPGVYHCWVCWKKDIKLLAAIDFFTFNTQLYQS